MNKIGRENLRWRWAYSALINHLNDDKDEWIEDKWIAMAQSKKGWGINTFNNFLKAYTLQRSIPRDVREKFIRSCHRLFRKALPVPEKDNYQEFADEASTTWAKAVADKNFPKKYHSATLKMFWFYHPEKLPMYDSHARVALQYEARQLCFDAKVDPRNPQKNYLKYFYKFYYKKGCESIIEQVRGEYNDLHSERGSLDREYNFRVADQYLWLAGSGQETKKLKCKKFLADWGLL